MQRNECLEQAKVLINGDRAVDYGAALTNHQRIAALWSAYSCRTYSPVDVAMMMMLV